jgi:hypothetical protein
MSKGGERKNAPAGWAAVLTGALGLAACQTAADVRPAAFEQATPEALGVLRQALGAALGRTRIDLGPSDLTRDSVVAVLPLPLGPYEGNSPALPILFELVVQGERCFIRRKGETELRELPDVRCRPLP